ncbi:RICIN domain-containing protein [Streptomyces sp. NPDC047049]|uniref:RICIN domain-containing protein n=1 Tax=Streptomyces sp. NPDC047049 TaxID=3156688 RepID=UPI0033D5A72F
MFTQEKKRRGLRAVVAKRPAAAALALAVVLGSGAAGGFTASAATSAASGTTYNSSASEPDTWIQGQTQMPILKHLIKGTTFLDWSRPGLTQTVKIKNITGQNIYVLHRTKALFVIADVAAASTSLATAIASGGFGIASEARARNALNSIERWNTDLEAKLKSLQDKNYTDQQKSDGQVQTDVAKAIYDAATSLNGDAKTLCDGVLDLFGRMSTDNAQSALDDGNKFDQLLFEKIKDQAITIKNKETESVRSDNYWKNLITWGLVKANDVITGSLAADFEVNPVATVANELLGVVNIFGVSGVAGQLGFPTVDMYVIREDKHGVHMSTAPNISWIASLKLIAPGKKHSRGDISPLPGIGHYLWRDMTKSTDSLDGQSLYSVDDQTLYRRAYNALESDGFDAAAATKIMRGILAGLKKGAGATAEQAGKFTEQTAAQLVLKPNFRKLVWLEYYAKTTATGPDQAKQGGKQAVAEAIAKVPTRWAEYPVFWLELSAAYGLWQGSGGFSAWSQEASAMYDACVSATWYGANFWDARKLLQRIGRDFDFGTRDVWTSSVPKDNLASEYVQIVAAVLASAGHVNHAFSKIDALSVTFGGAPGQVKVPSSRLLEWWTQDGDFPAPMPVDADNVAHKIKLGSHPEYCLTILNGRWYDGSEIIIDKYSCNTPDYNTAEEWTFATNGQLQAGGGDGKFCLTGADLGAVQLKSCKSDTSGQQWRRYSDQTVHLHSDAGTDTGYCLASPTASPDSHVYAKTVKCDAADPKQSWTFSYYSNIPTITFNSAAVAKSRDSVGVKITYTCTGDVAKITGYASDYGRFVYGGGQITPTCDGKSHSDTITVPSAIHAYFTSNQDGYAWAVMEDAHGQPLASTPSQDVINFS